MNENSSLNENPQPNSANLLPCPFCGETEKVQVWPAECGSRTGFRAGCLNPECDINPYTRTIWESEDKAKISWNSRTNAR